MSSRQKRDRDEGVVNLPNDYDEPCITRLKDDVRLRHETVNERFKQWAVLKDVHRHELCRYGKCFDAVAALTQIAINCGEELHQYQCGFYPMSFWRARCRKQPLTMIVHGRLRHKATSIPLLSVVLCPQTCNWPDHNKPGFCGTLQDHNQNPVPKI